MDRWSGSACIKNMLNSTKADKGIEQVSFGLVEQRAGSGNCRASKVVGASKIHNENSVVKSDAELVSSNQIPGSSSTDIFVSVLQKCRKAKLLDDAKCIYGQICQSGPEFDKSTGNYIVPMFVECGSLYNAQEVITRLVHRNEHSWTSLISMYIESRQVENAFLMYDKMQEDGISPSSYTLTALLRTFPQLKDAGRLKQLHIEVIKKSLLRDLYIGSCLIDMYAKCGLLAEAEAVFDKLPVRNVVTWNTLIACYAESGLGWEALKCYQQIQSEGIFPDAVTFISILKSCSYIGAIDEGRRIHMEILQRGLETDLFVSSTLLDMYAKCGSLVEAREVFNNLPVRNVVSWTVLIAGYAEHGGGQEALKCLGQMQLEGILPNAATFKCSLKACGTIGAIDTGREIHKEIAQSGYQKDPHVGSALVDMYVKCGSFLEAHLVFDSLPFRDVILWNVLIAGYSEGKFGQEALICFEQMRLAGLIPDAFTFVCILKACGSIGAIGKGREIHAEIRLKEFQIDNYVGSTLVDMYAKCGLFAEAREVLHNVPARDVVCWTALITGYMENGLHQEALECFRQMQQDGVPGDAITFVCSLKACGSIGAIDEGRKIHTEIAQKGLENDPLVCSSLFHMYVNCGAPTDARKVFDNLQARDIVSWNALIAGYAANGLNQEALALFQQMQVEGVSVDAVTFLCTLKACGNIRALETGREIHNIVAQKGLESELSIGSTLIDMYAKCGMLTEAQEVFDKLPVQNFVPWTAMISGYGMNHEGKKAVQCFEEMQRQDVKPDAITFVCLLTACSRASLVSEGQSYFKMMIEKYGIAPTVDHYTCMIDLLARSGQLYEAEILVKAVPCFPCKETWTALLSSCKTYGEIELGMRCFEQLVQMNGTPYALMANTCGSKGKCNDANTKETCWSDDEEVHESIKSKVISAI